MTLKDKDFIEVEYTAQLKESGEIFDTTNAEVAKSAGINKPHAHYKPILICLGLGQMLKGLEDQLVGKELGQEYVIVLSPENAFGKKDAKLLKIVPTNEFLKQGIRPVPGLSVNIDGIIGIIRSVNGGRTIADFNHPLSGHEVQYKIKVNRIITDKKEQLLGMLDVEAHIHDPLIEITENKVKITVEKLLPEPYMGRLASIIKEAIGLEATFEAKNKP